MSGDAKSTYIADVHAASHYLANLVARSELLAEGIKKATAEITRIEGEEPWGGTDEFGTAFQKQYNAGAGADVVKTQSVILAQETEQGARAAHGAVTASHEVDLDGSKLFKVETSDAVGTQLTTTHAAHNTQVKTDTGVDLSNPQQ